MSDKDKVRKRSSEDRQGLVNAWHDKTPKESIMPLILNHCNHLLNKDLKLLLCPRARARHWLYEGTETGKAHGESIWKGHRQAQRQLWVIVRCHHGRCTGH